MNTPAFAAVAADIRDEFSAETRDRQAIDAAAATASHYVDPQINLAANLIRQQHIGTHEALVLLHAILQQAPNSTWMFGSAGGELYGVILGLADEVIDIAQAHGERDPDAKRDEERDDEMLKRREGV